MTEKTRAQLVERALQVLGVVAAGQPIASEDQALVDAQVEPTIERLNKLSVTYIGDYDAIPLAQFQDLAVLLANAVKSDFGLAALPQDDPMKAMADLKTINAGHPSGAVLQAEYF